VEVELDTASKKLHYLLEVGVAHGPKGAVNKDKKINKKVRKLASCTIII
jgi:hypothetical protein